MEEIIHVPKGFAEIAKQKTRLAIDYMEEALTKAKAPSYIAKLEQRISEYKAFLAQLEGLKGVVSETTEEPVQAQTLPKQA